MKLTKHDLAIRISEETGMLQQEAQDIVQKILDVIAKSLAEGHNVELRNFGVFSIAVRRARIGRNPNSPQSTVPIPQRSVVKFKAGKKLRAKVLRLSAPKTAASSKTA